MYLVNGNKKIGTLEFFQVMTTVFKEEIKSLVKLRILQEVKEHTDWVNSYMIVENDTGSHHSPNHTIKKKMRICLDPRDLNEALEMKPYHTNFKR